MHLAPPILAREKDALGRPRKIQFGPWMMWAFRVLAKFKVLRGTPLDMFGHSPDRILERDLISSYEKDVGIGLARLSPDSHDTVVELLSLPDRIRGFGPVKEKAVTGRIAPPGRLIADPTTPPEGAGAAAAE